MRTHINLQFVALVLGAALLVSRPASQAAIIVWGLPTLISGDSDVSTHGTLIGAFNTGGPAVANTTVNGVPFAPFELIGPSVTSGDFTFSTSTNLANSDTFGSTLAPFSNLSAPYRVLLGSAAGSIVTVVTLTINNLTVGAAYEFEWWSNYSAGSTPPYTTIATAGDSVSLIVNVSGAAGGVGSLRLATLWPMRQVFRRCSACVALTAAQVNR